MDIVASFDPDPGRLFEPDPGADAGAGMAGVLVPCAGVPCTEPGALPLNAAPDVNAGGPFGRNGARGLVAAALMVEEVPLTCALETVEFVGNAGGLAQIESGVLLLLLALLLERVTPVVTP